MIVRRRLTGIALLLVMLFVAAACGQKPGVFAEGLPEGFAVNEQGQIVNTETGEVVGSAEDLTAGGGVTGALGDTGTTTGGDTGGTTTGGDTGGTTNGGDDDGGTTGTAPSGGNTTGVSNDKIVIGLHAPLTGAAPVPSDSVEKGKDLYARWMTEVKGKSIHGRTLEVVLKNDNYTPSQAVAVCKEMVEKEEVFLLAGAAGTDQIQACARYAASVNVPYLSAGVTEVGLTGLPNYFSLSMTYPDQGPLLADYMINRLGAKGEKNGMLWFKTPNFQDAHDAFVSALNARGSKLVYDRGVSKQAGVSDAQTVVQEMRAAGVENVYILTSPVWWIEVLKVANSQNYNPQWTGVGITMTFDTIANVACRSGQSIDGAQIFSPFPAWFDRNKYDPEFNQAVQKFYASSECTADGCGDDFMWLSWMLGKTYWQLHSVPGKALTRERFVYYVERARGLKSGIGPTLNFSPDDHFGADQVHVLEARCSDRRWHTIASFASDF